MDGRQLSAPVERATLASNPTLRAELTAALAPLSGPRVVRWLRAALFDHDRAVRLAAAYALSAVQSREEAKRATQPALVAALASADSPEERRAILRALGALLQRADTPLLGRALASAEPLEQAGACDAYASLLARGRAPDTAVVHHIAQLTTSASSPILRRACAQALAGFHGRPRAAGPDPLVSDRQLALLDYADTELRRAALAALSHFAAGAALPGIKAAALDSEPRIAAEALRALAALEQHSALLEVLQQRTQRLLDFPQRLAGPALPVLRLGCSLLGERAAQLDLGPLTAALDAVTTPRASDPPRQAARRALLQCSAAELADRVHGWPQRVFDCGTEAPPWVRDAAVARLLALASDAVELRAARLAQLLEHPSAASRVAALKAAATLSPAQASPLLARGLRDRDPAVVAAALDAMVRLGAKPEAPQRSALGAVSAALDGTPAAQLAWLRAVTALSLRAAEPAVRQLARSPRSALAAAAGQLLRDWDLPLPAVSPAVADTLDSARLPPRDARFHVQLTTTAGRIEIALAVDRVPANALRFLDLTRGGGLDGLPVGDGVPGLLVRLGTVVRAADFRREGPPTPVERGSVLVEDHGPDAPTGALLIALAREPALDGRFTSLGEVVGGIELLDGLDAGDRILEARVVVPDRPAASAHQTDQNAMSLRTEPL